MQSIELSRDFNENGFIENSFSIVLCDFFNPAANRKLLLTFFGVKDLKFGNLDTMVRHIISITDIRNHQLEDINYRVTEDENDLFSLCCRTFKYEIME